MKVHDVIQAALRRRGYVTRWVVVAEVMTKDQDRELHVHAGNGVEGDSPPMWDIIGMLDHASMMVRYEGDYEDSA